MQAPQISILAAGTEVQSLIVPDQIVSASMSTTEQGSEKLDLTVDMSPLEAVRLLDRIGVPEAIITLGPEIIWRGRVEDAEIVGTGLRLGAYGRWRDLMDQLQTRVYSDSLLSRWKITTTNAVARAPAKYNVRISDILSIALRKNEVYGNNVEGCSFYYDAPHGGSTIRAIEFSYELKLPAGFKLECYTWSNAWVPGAIVFTLTATGAIQTGTASFTFTPNEKFELDIYNSSGASITVTAETGAWYLRVYNVRIKDTVSATVQPTEIIKDLVPLAPKLNQSTALIATNTFDLKDEVYEDDRPSDIMKHLALLGDSSGNMWEVGVDLNNRVFYRVRGAAAREWYLNAETLEYQTTMADVWNSVYGVYVNAANVVQRTAVATDAASIARVGVTRKAAIGVQTNSVIQSQYRRDVWLNDHKAFRAKAAIRASYVMTAGGCRVPAWNVRAGDYININGLPLAPGGSLDKLRRFRVTHTDADLVAGVTVIEPDGPQTLLDAILARQAERLRADGDLPPLIGNASDFTDSRRRDGGQTNTGAEGSIFMPEIPPDPIIGRRMPNPAEENPVLPLPLPPFSDPRDGNGNIPIRW